MGSENSKTENQDGLSTDNNAWLGNILKVLIFGSGSWILVGPFLISAVFGYPELQQEIMFLANSLPPDTTYWKKAMNIDLISDNYSITYSQDNNWIYLDPWRRHENTLIFLHGWRGRADDFFYVFSNRNIAPETTRIILPQAPYSRAEIWGTYFFQWFNILDSTAPKLYGTSLTMDDKEKLYDQPQILEQADIFLKVIEEERLEFPIGKQTTKRIYIGGFSQGCMMALATFLRYQGPDPLGGIIGVSGLQALNVENLKPSPEARDAQSKTPMLLIHGVVDTTIKFPEAKHTYDYFDQLYQKFPENYKFISEQDLDHDPTDLTWNYVAAWMREKTKLTDKIGADPIDSGGYTPLEPTGESNIGNDSGPVDRFKGELSQQEPE